MADRRDPYGKPYPYQHDWDVENPMFCPNLSGRLQHHDQECPECEGSGYEDYEGDYEQLCSACENGKRGWGCWYGEDKGLCGTCGAENALVAGMYDSSDQDECYVCLACYVRHHKEACGCDLWKWAERMLVLFMPTD